jgi:hypothetical protein
VLLYWADRLEGVVCTARGDVVAALEVALGPRTKSSTLEMAEPKRINEAQAMREAIADKLGQRWTAMRRLSRRRGHDQLDEIAYALTGLAEALGHAPEPQPWRLALGQGSLPDPALLLCRVLNGEDPQRAPPLPRKKVRRRPLCLVAAS